MRDGHHILHHRQEWSLRPHARQLRETPSLVPKIDRDSHESLHANCPPVPLLGHYALMGTLMRFEPTGDTFQDISGLQSAMERTTRLPRFHRIDRELAGLAIDALDLQIPYIREGIMR